MVESCAQRVLDDYQITVRAFHKQRQHSKRSRRDLTFHHCLCISRLRLQEDFGSQVVFVFPTPLPTDVTVNAVLGRS
jgi:hypothetical protein